MNQEIKPGDKILHKTYGWGIVLSTGNSIEVNFG